MTAPIRKGAAMYMHFKFNQNCKDDIYNSAAFIFRG